MSNVHFQITNVVFSALAIAEISHGDLSRDLYDDEGSLSGSMLSLARSNSSTSFPPNSV